MRTLSFTCSWWNRTSFEAIAANIRTGTFTSPKLIAPPQIGLGMRLLTSDSSAPGDVRAAVKRSCLHEARVPHGPRGLVRRRFSAARSREPPTYELPRTPAAE